MSDGRLVGIVARANLVQALASAPRDKDIPLSDQAIRDKLTEHKAHISRYGDDLPEIAGWQWGHAGSARIRSTEADNI